MSNMEEIGGGELRASNRLLIKNEIGKGKMTTFILPPIGHVYGKSPTKDPEGAKQGEIKR